MIAFVTRSDAFQNALDFTPHLNTKHQRRASSTMPVAKSAAKCPRGHKGPNEITSVVARRSLNPPAHTLLKLWSCFLSFSAFLLDRDFETIEVLSQAWRSVENNSSLRRMS